MNDVTRPMDPPLEPMECDNDVPPVPGMRQAGTGNSARQETNIDNSKDKRVNDWGPWVGIACIFAGIAFGGLVIFAILLPAMIEARVAAGKAEVRSEFAQQLADVRASSNTAREHARVALDKVEQTQVQLGAKGLVTPSTH